MNGESFNKTPLTTAKYYTAEPTYTEVAGASAVVKTMILPLPIGPYDIEEPLGREFYVPPIDLFVVRLTSTTVSPNAYTNICIEE